jgi:tRNA(Ile)-lysidine synthase
MRRERIYLDKLEKKVEENLRKYQMVKKGDSVLVCVSGGPDSVALFYILKALSPLHQLTLGIFHLDHLLRGEEGKRDAEFVEEIAKENQIPAFIHSYDVSAFAQEKKLSLEEAGRIVRYKLAKEVAEREGFTRIALGHQADDQVETFLLRLMRGTSLSGLKGIPPVRGEIIRPLINIYREEIEAYLKRKEIPFREDSTNINGSNLRSKVRHYLLPYFKTYNPQFREATLKLMSQIKSEEEYIEKKAEEEVSRKIKKIKGGVRVKGPFNFPPPLVRRMAAVILRFDEEVSRKVSRKHIEELSEGMRSTREGFILTLPKGYFALKDGNDLLIVLPGSLKEKKRKPLLLNLPGEVSLWDLGWKIRASQVGRDEVKLPPPDNTAYLDAAKLEFPLTVRTWKPGDRFVPLGMSNSKKLQDFFVDEKVPRSVRKKVPIVESAGEIVWVVGYRISEKFKIDEETENVVILEVGK